MERYGTHNIVYSSSATVYGAPSKIPIPEVSPLSPESVYGRTKMFSELIIKDVCDSKPDTWRAIGLRYFNPAGEVTSLGWRSQVARTAERGRLIVFACNAMDRVYIPGAHPSGLIGEDPRGRPGNLLPLLAHIAVGKIENDLKVFGNDYPTPDGACVVRRTLPPPLFRWPN
jgi:UDP-glucose 4-epimerase